VSAIIKDNFRITSLQQFINSLGADSLYMGIGRPQFWDTVSSIDVPVKTPENTLEATNDDWDDMLALKRVNSSDAYMGIFKEVWQANVKYDTYRHDWNGTRVASYNGASTSVSNPTSMSDVKCVIVNASGDIYMCLKQGIINNIVQPSTISPEIGTFISGTTTVRSTSDGYHWKFIGVTSSADTIKFATPLYNPVETLPSDLGGIYTSQWNAQVESAIHKGGIYTVNITNGGANYNNNVAETKIVTNAETDLNFKIVGDGNSLTYDVVYASGGIISEIIITNPGTGYSHVSITAEPGGAGGAGATFDVIYTPMSGLGTDPIRDLFARYLLLGMTIESPTDIDFTTANDFRKIVLVMNPTNYGTSTQSTAVSLDSSIKINVGSFGAGDYPVDDVIVDGTTGASGRIVDADATSGDIRIIRTIDENATNLGANNSFTVGNALNASTGTGTSIIVSITNPTVNKYSGDVIYADYRSPTNRSNGQTDNIKIIIKF